jgi:glycerophosphoryl diester phosphodiesterase
MRDTSFLKGRLIAHRGCHDTEKGIPENSMLAFDKAVKRGFIIELDVHILKDGNIVVFHDDNLKRMTGVNKKIADCFYGELKNVKLQNSDESIPLLKDVLKLVNGKVPIIIELKSDTKNYYLEKELINLLKNYPGKCAIKSFNPFSVRYFYKNYPDIIRGIIISEYNKKKKKTAIFGKRWLIIIAKPDFISYDIRALPNRRITSYKKKRLVLGWTIRNNDDLKKAKQYCDNYICENIDSMSDD